MIQIAPSSFLMPYDPNPPQAATPETAKVELEKFLADLAADKFNQGDPYLNSYQTYLEQVIRDGGVHPAFPPYPKFKA